MIDRDLETRRRELTRNVRAGMTSERDVLTLLDVSAADYARGVEDGRTAGAMESVGIPAALVGAVGAFLTGAAFSALVLFPW